MVPGMAKGSRAGEGQGSRAALAKKVGFGQRPRSEGLATPPFSPFSAPSGPAPRSPYFLKPWRAG